MIEFLIKKFFFSVLCHTFIDFMFLSFMSHCHRFNW